jgi:hypothetical protein
MQLTLTWQDIITAASVLAAIIALAAFFAKIVRWVDKQDQQDKEIQDLKKHHEDDVKSLKEEQTLLVFGILACLKGLQEKGCNGPVTEAIGKYEKYLNQKAHQ